MKFSILMPLFNHETFVGEAVESVLSQTFGNWELIVCDDGSTDNSPDEVRRFKDGRIKLIQKKNGGVATALNHSLINSTGDIITWLSSDDVYAPEKLAAHLRYHLAGEKISLLPAAHLEANGKIKPYSPSRTPIAQHRLAYFYLSHNYVNGLAIAFDRSLVGDVGLFSPRYRYAQDEDYWIRLIKQAPIAYADTQDPLSFSRLGSASNASEGTWGLALDPLVVLYNSIRERGPLAMVPIEFERSTPSGLLKSHLLSLLMAPNFRLNSIHLQDQVILQYRNWLLIRGEYSKADRDALAKILQDAIANNLPEQIKLRFIAVHSTINSQKAALQSCIDIRDHIWTLYESGILKCDFQSMTTYVDRLTNF
jgi:teichuronic acid biosynthesis glycosyltransferase TuaG